MVQISKRQLTEALAGRPVSLDAIARELKSAGVATSRVEEIAADLAGVDGNHDRAIAGREEIDALQQKLGGYSEAEGKTLLAAMIRAAKPSAIDGLQPGGRFGLHGMVFFGSGDQLLMSHIPMFHPPHDMQLVIEVRLPELAAPAGLGDGLFTLKPKSFSLDDLIAGRLTQFQGTIFRGSFEKDGRPISRPVTVEVKSILDVKKLEDDGVAAAHPEYRVFGTPSEAYLVHRISAPTDFDQVVRAKLDSSEPLPPGASLVFPDRANTTEARLEPGVHRALLKPGDREVTVRVERELSALLGPDFVDAP